MIKLSDLEDGRSAKGDNEVGLSPPENFDFEKFHRGRTFFKDNVFSCTLAMYFSLIVGLSIPNLLNALVFTENSNTAKKAFRRYLKTFQQISLWHYENIWNPESPAYQSIQMVRRQHNNVREQMHASVSDSQHIFLSQFDMAQVQSGFVGAIILYPEVVGIKCQDSNLEDYVYFWYGIGHLLGIEQKYNICAGGLQQAQKLCKDIEQDIENTCLIDPHPQFIPMMQALIAAFNPLKSWTRLLSFSVVLKVFHKPICYKWLSFSLSDIPLLILWRFIFFMMKNCKAFKNIMNQRFEKSFHLVFKR